MTLRTESYAYQIQSQNDVGMSGEAKTMYNNLMTIFARRLMTGANILSQTDSSKTLVVRDLNNALEIWLVTHPEFFHSLSEYATTAVNNYYAKINQKGDKPLLKSIRAGITMPVTRIEHYLREITFRHNVSEKASIFFAALLDIVCQRICRLAAQRAVDDKKQRVTHKHISEAIRNNPDLTFVFKDTILGGGTSLFIPHI